MVTVFSDPNVINYGTLTYEVIINFHHIDRKYRWKITKHRIDRKTQYRLLTMQRLM